MPIDDTHDTHGLKVIPPHELPGQLRVCYRGVLTLEDAQARLGNKYRVLELRPAQCLGEDKTSNLVAATEVIFTSAQ
jgi:hypothetical protein